MEDEKDEGGRVLAFFKQIGLPGIVAAIISAMITMIPFLFKLDERYAKADDTDAKLTMISKQVNDLSVELGRLAGTQQVMVAIMSAKREVRFADAKSSPTPEVAPLTAAPPPIATTIPKTPEERSARLEDVSKSLEHTQAKVQQIQQSIKP
jgi:hypothetical protein